ncbi:hypothetical protein HJFPF1_02510 [Paramyrothecium foliicola]|nr:hypothetical protein HJFPF1_02510 [Paramyrothecium foliicola]
MAIPFQMGDCVTFGKLAWDIWRCGFDKEANASKHYTEFGRHVKSLATNLGQLERIVILADREIQSGYGREAKARWNWASVKEIVGDYDSTLRECRQLLDENVRHARGTGVARNLQWHALVQPTADRLRERIMLHNSKILYLLKPFEIDLMRRIHQNIQNMHGDLRDQMIAMHMDVRLLKGDVLSDVKRADRPLEAAGQLLNVPSILVNKFTRSALADKGCPGLADLKLEDLSDALMFNFEKLPKKLEDLNVEASNSSPGPRYLSLMKCLWLFNTMRDLMRTSSTGPDTHWPGYLRQFEKDLCIQCEQFALENVPENPIAQAGLDSEAYSLWPCSEASLLDDIVAADEDMEKLLDRSPLLSPTPNMQRHVTLLRRPGSKNRPLCAMVSGSPLKDNTRQKPQNIVIDFNWTSTILNPDYALPANFGGHKEMILQRDGKAVKLEFTSLKDVFKFQQAVTGFRPWDCYCEYNVDATFVVSGRRDPIAERACVQLWYPKTTMVNTNPGGARPSSLAGSINRARAATSLSSSSTDNASSQQIFVHQSPTKPMLVLFTQGKWKDQDKLSLVTIDIGSGAEIVTERCNCRYSGNTGPGCLITAIENRQGASYLDARRYETRPNDEVGWNLMHLAQVNSPSAGNEWRGLKRVTLRFSTSKARAIFSGTPSQCQCRKGKQGELTRCLNLGHRGYWGEVQEFHRQQMNEYHETRYKGRKQLIHGTS